MKGAAYLAAVPRDAYWTLSMRSECMITSLCVADDLSTSSQALDIASWKLRMLMLPKRIWITRGGGPLIRIRLEKSLSFVMIVRFSALAYSQICWS